MNNTEFDIVIIGGGPAGSICAISLMKLNPELKVCIVDRKKFPRDKSCGDGLGPGVHKIITDLNLEFLFSESHPIEKLAITSPNGYELNSELPKMGDIKPLGFVIPVVRSLPNYFPLQQATHKLPLHGRQPEQEVLYKTDYILCAILFTPE